MCIEREREKELKRETEGYVDGEHQCLRKRFKVVLSLALVLMLGHFAMTYRNSTFSTICRI